jgi:hypothetical protein
VGVLVIVGVKVLVGVKVMVGVSVIVGVWVIVGVLAGGWATGEAGFRRPELQEDRTVRAVGITNPRKAQEIFFFIVSRLLYLSHR